MPASKAEVKTMLEEMMERMVRGRELVTVRWRMAAEREMRMETGPRDTLRGRSMSFR